MSTLRNNITAQRIARLATKNEVIFHSDDLANLWLIKNKNTLRITLKRYVDHGLLHRIYKGLYSLPAIEDLNPALIGAKALHQFCYLSTETILYLEGYISQKIDLYTFVSEKSLNLTINHQYHFKSRQLKSLYLYNPEGVYEENGLKKATALRAVADMLYFNPVYHFDKLPDWKKVKALQKKIGYPFTKTRYDFTKTS